MIEGKCDCGKLLMTFDEELKGSVLIICPDCEATQSWQSTIGWGEISIPEGEEKSDATN